MDVGKKAQATAEGTDLLNRTKRWFPFSEGPRSCVGQTLANMNVTGTLATLLAHYHFRLADQVMPGSIDICTIADGASNPSFITFARCNALAFACAVPMKSMLISALKS